jgi:hypothetical protein
MLIIKQLNYKITQNLMNFYEKWLSWFGQTLKNAVQMNAYKR